MTETHLTYDKIKTQINKKEITNSNKKDRLADKTANLAERLSTNPYK